MKPTPKRIQIYLPSGDPQGIRIAEFATRTLQVIEVPRKLLHEFAKMSKREKGEKGAVYLLFGEDDEGELSVYIGETSNLCNRLAKHNKEKDFWKRAVAVISRSNHLTPTHWVILERLCLKAAQAVGRYAIENHTSGTKSQTPAPLDAECRELFETAGTLVSTLGYPIFDALAKASSTEEPSRVFFCTRPGVDGRGLYTSEGFVVLKESVGNLQLAPSIGSAVARKREQLLKSGDYSIEGDKVILGKDCLFSSPTMAAKFLIGKGSNGWDDWKDEAGRTLDELERQETEDDQTE
jgi:hypothetical protein